jgi:hypothetical protein
MKTKRTRRPAAPDYRARWAPYLDAIRARLAAGEVITVTNAFGAARLESVSWSEVTGCTYHTGRGFSARSFVADLGWVERVAAGGAS